MSPDPWSAFLEWLNTVLVPNWGELISLLPYVLVGTIVGPILTLILLMWGWHLLRRRRGRVRRAAVQAVPAPRDAAGVPLFPVNVPYCTEHGLIHPPRSRTCEVDRADLVVACPVDGTLRVAEVETCPACGTTFKLGAAAASLAVVTVDGPPAGGAAAA
jgi:hypothetical protein